MCELLGEGVGGGISTKHAVNWACFPGNFDDDLLLDAVWWTQGLFLHKHNLPCIVSLKLL